MRAGVCPVVVAQSHGQLKPEANWFNPPSLVPRSHPLVSSGVSGLGMRLQSSVTGPPIYLITHLLATEHDH